MSDQTVQLTTTELRVFDEVDRIITAAVTSGDPVPAFGFAEELVRAGQVRGLALAKLFYSLESKWELFQQAGFEDNFIDFATAHTGRSPQTITKYSRMWGNIFENPDIPTDTKKKLMGRDIGQLLLLTGIASEGVDPVIMQELAETPDESSLKDKLREERGDRTSSASAVRLFVQVRESTKFPRGTVYVERGRDREIVAVLDLDSPSELVQKANARIINNTKMTENL